MSTADFTPKTIEVARAGRDSFFVRGLSASDLTTLVHSHLPGLEVMAGLFDEEGGLHGTRLEFLQALNDVAPDLVVTVIAMGADAPEAVDLISKMPFPTQINALLAIGKLTFEEAGGPKKALQLLAQLIQQAGRDRQVSTTTVTHD